ncbi:MAG: hypothetical protein AABX73_00150 [Nanoarchaeota archaeon]
MVKVGDFTNPQMHMIGRADFKDVVRHQEMQRRRRFFIILDIIAVLSLVIGIFVFRSGLKELSYFLFGLTAVIVLFFIFRKIGRSKRKNNFRRQRDFRRKRFSRRR